MRYMQVLDHDDDYNYIVLYKCMETSTYKDSDGTELKAQAAWRKSTRTGMDFTKRPIVEYKMDDGVTVEQKHFNNIKILWRTNAENLDNMDGESVKYPSGSTGPTDEKIAELKAKVAKLLPE